jgi:hypothetical protein
MQILKEKKYIYNLRDTLPKKTSSYEYFPPSSKEENFFRVTEWGEKEIRNISGLLIKIKCL